MAQFSSANGPRVPQKLFIGFLWVGTALSLCLVAFRLYVRLRAFKRVYWDDILALAAGIFLLVTAILWQTQIFGLYASFGLANGSLAPTPSVLDAFITQEHVEVAILFMFYSCLWSIKLSFLIFFRRLGNKVQGHRVWWWCVMGLTAVTYITCLGLIQYRCLLNDLQYIQTQCIKASAIHFENVTFHYLLAIDLITDCSIITIPIIMLWNVRIPLKQKLGLIGIFSLTVVVMIIAIVRVVAVNKLSKQADPSWLYFWTNLEMIIAIMISSLASFRQLFVKAERAREAHPRCASVTTRKGLLNKISFNSTKSLPYSTHQLKLFGSSRRTRSSHSTDSDERIVPSNNIRVNHKISVSNEIA